MSDVLVKQLQQVLAPWDTLGDNAESLDGTAVSQNASFGAMTHAIPQDVLSRSRAATTRLELARAALALFASNAGVFRPFLIKLFRFLFDAVDALRGDMAQWSMERLLWQQQQSTGNTNAAHLDFGGATPEEQSAVAAAYEKVRVMESRMAALVEEASVQRDHFKAQIEVHTKRQYHLEDLLQHQMELTQTLLDHRLRQELTGERRSSGGGGGTTATSAGEEMRMAGAGTSAVERQTGNAFAPPPLPQGARGIAMNAAATFTDGSVGTPDRQFRASDRRDVEYVHCLIARAERELTLERTEAELHELRTYQDELDKKVQSLLKLNSKYARQSMELAARLSILHEHNIAIAADAQLYQRDLTREQQRSAYLLHALHVARGLVLTLLQVQPICSDAAGTLEQLEWMDKAAPEPLPWSLHSGLTYSAGEKEATVASPRGSPAVKTQQSNNANPVMAPGLQRDASLACTEQPFGTPTKSDAFAGAFLQFDEADQLEEALRAIRDVPLRRQLQDILGVEDAAYSGRVKTALLQFLQLQHAAVRDRLRGTTFSASSCPAPVHGWLSPPSVHQWVPPCGLRTTVPRHLRCAAAVPLLVLHPLFAEAFVHELLTERQNLLAFAQQQREQAAQRAQEQQQQWGEGISTGGGGRPSIASLRDSSFLMSSYSPSPVPAASFATVFASFPDFIELFVSVVWLGRVDRYLALLPSMPTSRNRHEETVLREKARAKSLANSLSLRGGGGAGGGDTTAKGRTRSIVDVSAVEAAAPRITLWDLRHVLHLVGPSAISSSSSPKERECLPVEGLQLTYGLDVASRQVDAGPLTYAYGLTSRGLVCEALFSVLRAEREALLHLCRAVDAEVVANAHAMNAAEAGKMHTRGEREVPAQDSATANNTSTATATDSATASTPPIRGWIPTVQFVRILLSMYPGYTRKRLEQLIQAAVKDGTEGAESPATLFYEALLPARMLPGPTISATSADTSISVGTTFASAFYVAICEDALESLQSVEDSVTRFARGETRSESGGGVGRGIGGEGETAAAAAGGDVSDTASVTARQITSLAFLGIPSPDAQQWGAALRTAIYRWPRLRSTFADPTQQTATSASTEAAAAQKPFEETEADQVSSVARVPVEEVMPYLRRSIIVRRGLYARPESVNERSPAWKGAAAAPSREMKEAPEANAVISVTEADGWTGIQAALLRRWELQWEQYSSAAATSGSASASLAPTAFAGPTRAIEYRRLLQQLDPYRTRAWGKEELSRDNPLLHPVNYVPRPDAAPVAPPRASVAFAPLRTKTKSTVTKATKKRKEKAR